MKPKPPDPPELVTTSLIKAARALLGWSQNDLADRSGISRKTISLIEAAEGTPTDERRIAGLRRVRETLEEAGVIFTFRSRKSGEGVLLKD